MKTTKQIIEEARAKLERRWIIGLIVVLSIYAIFALSTLSYLLWLNNSEAKQDSIQIEKQNAVSDSIDIKIREARRILDSLENL